MVDNPILSSFEHLWDMLTCQFLGNVETKRVENTVLRASVQVRSAAICDQKRQELGPSKREIGIKGIATL